MRRNIRAISGIRTRDPSNRAAVVLLLTLKGHRGSINLIVNYASIIGNWRCWMVRTDARYSQL